MPLARRLSERCTRAVASPRATGVGQLARPGGSTTSRSRTMTPPQPPTSSRARRLPPRLPARRDRRAHSLRTPRDATRVSATTVRGAPPGACLRHGASPAALRTPRTPRARAVTTTDPLCPTYPPGDRVSSWSRRAKIPLAGITPALLRAPRDRVPRSRDSSGDACAYWGQQIDDARPGRSRSTATSRPSRRGANAEITGHRKYGTPFMQAIRLFQMLFSDNENASSSTPIATPARTSPSCR